MKFLLISFGVSLACVGLAICAGKGGKMNDILKAKSVKIGYMINGQRKHLTISDAAKVKDILATISIDETDDSSAGHKPKGTVDFILGDDRVINTSFVRSARLDRTDAGQIYLKDTKFYEKINQILSEKEGRMIDVLQDNK